ncbi:MAG: hypothetical protein ACFB2Z_05965 [Maricaulaceae bacterium]
MARWKLCGACAAIGFAVIAASAVSWAQSAAGALRVEDAQARDHIETLFQTATQKSARDGEGALDDADRAIALAEDLGDERLIARANLVKAGLAVNLRRSDLVETPLQAGLDYALAQGDAALTCHGGRLEAQHALQTGLKEFTLKCVRRAREACREAKNQRQIFALELMYGNILTEFGRIEDAISVYNSLLAETEDRETDTTFLTPEREAAVQTLLGKAYSSSAMYPDALAAHERAAALYTSVEHLYGQAVAAANISDTYLSLENYKSAALFAEVAETNYRAVGAQEAMLHIMDNRARIAAAQGRYREALRLGQQVLVDLRKMEPRSRDFELSVLENLAEFAVEARALNAAVSAYTDMLALKEIMYKAEREALLANPNARFETEALQFEVDRLNLQVETLRERLDRRTRQFYFSVVISACVFLAVAFGFVLLFLRVHGALYGVGEGFYARPASAR